MSSSISSTPLVTEAVTESELAQARLCLQQSQDAIVGATRGVSQAQAIFKPDARTWSITETLEHVVAVQERVLGPVWEQLKAAPPCGEDRDCRVVDAFILDRFPSRLKKFAGPGALQPTGSLPLSEGVDRVIANTRRLAELLESTPDLRQHAVESLPLKALSQDRYRAMDGYQWILANAAHTERHAKQILEIKAQPDFPSH